MPEHLFLSGFMGAGKSRIGRELAAKTGLPFIDTDKQIEERAGKSVNDIFEQDGEQHFRDLERQVIDDLSQQPLSSIIALGGGAVVNDEIRELVRSRGKLVYIKSSPERVFERVRYTRKRPLLKVPEDGDYEKNLFERIKQLLAQREPFYTLADIVIDRDQLELEQIVDRIIELTKSES